MDLATAKDILEILYFISGPVVAVAALIGLRQLSIAKRTASASAKRDAFKLSSQQISFYLNEMIPRQNELSDFADSEGLDLLEKSEVSVDSENITISVEEVDDPVDQMKKLGPYVLPVMNGMESFAAPMVSGVAAESVAFAAVGRTYCDSVRRLAPILVPLANDGYFRNVLALFYFWNPRLERENLMFQKAEIDSKLSKITRRHIPPIGS